MSLNPVTNQKMSNLQNIFTRLWIFVLTLFCCAFDPSHISELLRWNSLWTLLLHKRCPVCKNSVRRFIIIVLSLSYDAYHQSVTFKLTYGKNVAKPHNKPKDAQFAKLCMLHASESSFLPTFLELCIKTTFCRSYVKILAEPNCGPEDGQFTKHWHMHHRFQLDLWCLPSERHFEALSAKLSLNAIKTKNIAAFQNSVTWPWIILFI